MKKATTVTRPDPGRWGILILLYGGIGAFAISFRNVAANSKTSGAGLAIVWFGLLLFVAIFLVTSPGLYELIFRRMTWDEKGITNRTGRGTKFFFWDDIVDYGYYPAPGSSSTLYRRYFLLFRDGSRSQFLGNWENSNTFRDVVQERATKARASTWELIGSRRIDAPTRTFGYPALNTILLASLGGILLVWFSVYLFLHFLPKIQAIYTELGPGWGIACALTVSTLCFVLPLAIGYIHYRTAHSIVKNGNESIRVDADTIAFSDGKHTREYPWIAVVDYFIDGSRERDVPTLYTLLLAGDGNETITFHAGLQNSAALVAIIAQHAPAPPEKPWRFISKDTGDQMKPVGAWWGSDSQAQTYTYRNGLVRPIALLPTFCLLMVPLMMFLRSTMLQTPAALNFYQWGACGVGTLVVAYVWWRYYRGRIVTDARGIAQDTPLGIHRIRWEDVTGYRLQKDNPFQSVVIRGANKNQVAVSIFLNRFEDLQKEIQQRTGLLPEEH